MSEAAAAEPTMEEILASIRRIISEDEAPAAEAAPEPEEIAEAPAPVAEIKAAPEPEPAPPPPAAKEEVLELTQRVEPKASAPAPAPAPPSMGDLDFSDADVPAAAPPVAPRKSESLVSDHAATAAASHFGALGQALAMPAAGRTLEDVVKELMKPMLKAWLDENLPSITEAAVRSEVERISRRGH